MTIDGGKMCIPKPEGSPDMFGGKWKYIALSQGSMPVPGQDWLEDVNDWKTRFPLPDIDSYDWENQAKFSAVALKNPQSCPVALIFSGYFERLAGYGQRTGRGY